MESKNSNSAPTATRTFPPLSAAVATPPLPDPTLVQEDLYDKRELARDRALLKAAEPETSGSKEGPSNGEPGKPLGTGPIKNGNGGVGACQVEPTLGTIQSFIGAIPKQFSYLQQRERSMVFIDMAKFGTASKGVRALIKDYAENEPEDFKVVLNIKGRVVATTRWSRLPKFTAECQLVSLSEEACRKEKAENWAQLRKNIENMPADVFRIFSHEFTKKSLVVISTEQCVGHALFQVPVMPKQKYGTSRTREGPAPCIPVGSIDAVLFDIDRGGVILVDFKTTDSEKIEDDEFRMTKRQTILQLNYYGVLLQRMYDDYVTKASNGQGGGKRLPVVALWIVGYNIARTSITVWEFEYDPKGMLTKDFVVPQTAKRFAMMTADQAEGKA